MEIDVSSESRARRMVTVVTLAAVITATGLFLVGSAGAGGVAARPTLVVVVHGHGRVVSKPAGISCPGKCSATFATGTRVTVISSPKKGWKLLRWGGTCSGTHACKVKMTASTAVTAVFVASPKASPLAKPAVEPGYYSGLASGYSFKFFVSPTGRMVQNAELFAAAIRCTPAETGAPTSDRSFLVPVAVVRPNGSFSGKATQKGLVDDAPARITYSMSGRLMPANGSTPASAAGTFRVDIVYADSTTHTCTSGNLSFSARKSGPVPSSKMLVTPGTYKGLPGGYSFEMIVSPNRKSVVSIQLSAITLSCRPAESNAPTSDRQFAIPKATIKPNGSFSATATQSTVINGSPGKITYSIKGNLQGVDSGGRGTAAGWLRDDMTYTDSTGTHTCTSNDRPWYVAT